MCFRTLEFNLITVLFTIPASDRRTHRQTSGRTDEHTTAAHIALA